MAEAFNPDPVDLPDDLKIGNALENPEDIINQQLYEAHRRGRKPPLSNEIQVLRLQHRNNVIVPNAQHQSTIDASKVPLKDLMKISLTDLHMETAAKGGYLTLRTLENAYQNDSITTTIVEDDDGNAVVFSASNFADVWNPNLNDILPIGTVFILKEPYIEQSTAGGCVVRCDCPSDMIILFKGHELFSLVKEIKWKNAIDPNAVDPMFSDPVPTTALEWKERGNALFRAKKFEYATRCYLLSLQELTGLDNVGDLEQLLLMNASAAYLQRGLFEKGLEYAERYLDKYPGNKKILYRAGRCCYNLRKYEEAEMYFDECNALGPDDEDIKIELKITNDRLLEQAEGKLDIFNMFLTQSDIPKINFDCADYTGPVKVVKIPGKGRGVVARRDIEQGTLLVVSKALVYVWAPETESNQMQINYDIGRDCNIISDLVQLIAKNPKTFGAIVYDLHAGDDIVPVKGGLFCSPKTKEEPIVDVERIKAILTANCFIGNNNVPQDYDYLSAQQTTACETSGGLFILPSYFNHNCLPNATWTNINNVMFIRAIHEIKANEEVFLSYVSWSLTFAEKQSIFRNRGFQCNCTLCIRDSKTPKDTKDERDDINLRYELLLNDLKKTTEPKRLSKMKAVKTLLDKLLKTYKYETMFLNPTVYSMTALLTNFRPSASSKDDIKYESEIFCEHGILKLFYFYHDELLESIDNGHKLIPSGAYLTSQVLVAVASLVKFHHRAGQHDVKNKWIKILLALENLFSGGDINVVKFKYGFIRDLL